MNETVRSMVEKLFENTVMNDETKALMEEVMNNCQERCADLTEKGLPEEEILAAVSESLKGMEEIVAAYPKKEENLSDADFTKKTQDGPMTFDPASVTRLVARLTDGSMEVELADEPVITVELIQSGDTQLTAELENGTLRISQRRVPGGGAAAGQSRPSGSPWDTVASSINEAIRQLSQIVQRFGATVVSGENRVRVRIPASCRLAVDIQSLSGDLRWHGAPADQLLLDTTSGDLEAFAPAGETMRVAQCKSASGDIRVDLDADDLTMQSMSGDVQWSGCAERLTATSVSGDLSIAGSYVEGRFKSVSGDVDLSVDERAVQISAISTSGDVSLNLSPAVASAKTRLRTISGNTHVNNLLISDSAPLSIQADSVSGDITITRHKM